MSVLLHCAMISPPPHLPRPLNPSTFFEADNTFYDDILLDSVGISTLSSFSFSFDDASECIDDDTILDFSEEEEEMEISPPLVVSSDAAAELVDSTGCQNHHGSSDEDEEEENDAFRLTVRKSHHVSSAEENKDNQNNELSLLLRDSRRVISAEDNEEDQNSELSLLLLRESRCVISAEDNEGDQNNEFLLLRESHHIISVDGNVEEQNNELTFIVKEYVSKKKRGRLQWSFDRWRRLWRRQLLEKVTKEEILSQEYYRSKAEYQLDQKNSIASVHFKIGVLSDCFHKWRLFLIAQHVKRRREDVARIHYGDRVTAHYFKIWKDTSVENKCHLKQVESHILAKTFCAWKILTKASMVENQSKYEVALAYSNKRLLRNSYTMWKQHVLLLKADRQHEQYCKRRAFSVWTLQLLKRKLQRRLARSYRIKVMQRRFFVKWKSKSESVMQTRGEFCTKLERFVLRCYWQQFKAGIALEMKMRESCAAVHVMCKRNCLRHYFSVWKQQYKIQCFKKEVEKKNCQLVLRIHMELWRKRRKRLLLGRKVDLWNSVQGKLLSVKYLSRWQHQWALRKQKSQDYEGCLATMDHNKLGRCFATWKNQLHQEQVVKAFLEMKKWDIAWRCWKGWLLVKERGDATKVLRKNSMRQYFCHWQKRTEDQVEKRRKKNEKDRALLLKCVTKWKEYASLSRQRRDTSVACYARHWLDVTQQRVMTRKIEQAEKENSALITKIHFAKWQHRYDDCVRRRTRLEDIADKHHRYIVHFKVLNAWVRQQNVTTLVKNYRQEKAKLLLSSTFKQWLDVVEQDMQSQIHSFKEKLLLSQDSLQCSLQSTSTLVPFHPNQPLSKSPRSGSALSKSTVVSSVLSKSNDNLLDLYRNSVESSLVQEDQTLHLESDKSVGCSGFKTEQSDFLSVSLPPFSTTDTNNDSSYHQELVDYNTDNDVDQDQIWDEPITRSQLRLNFSSFSNATSEENHFLQSSTYSYQPCNISTKSTRSATWLYTWKSRYLHSKTLSQHQRFIQADILVPDFRSSILSMTCTLPDNMNLPLSLSDTEGTLVSGTVLDQRKVRLLYSILNYWKHLDVSAVFYSWLKHTQKKKYLRLMQKYLLEKKSRFHVHNAFLLWNRKLYIERAVMYFQEKTMKGRFFSVWLKYRRYRLQKFSQGERAVELRHKSLLKQCFQRWKNKGRLEQLLRGVNGSWTSQAEQSLNTAISQRKDKTVSNYFNAWKLALAQSRLSKHHADIVVQRKCLSAWQFVVTGKETAKRKVTEFQRDHLLKRVFFHWKNKVDNKVQIRQAEKVKEKEAKALVFSEWLRWTSVRLEQKDKVNVLQSRYEHSLLSDAFNEWKVHRLHSTAAGDLRNQKTASLFLSAWHRATRQSREERTKTTQLQEHASSKLLIRSYRLWRLRLEARRKMEQNTKEKEAHMLSVSFKTWRETTLCGKADRQYNNTLCKQTFHLWKEKYVSINETQFLTKISYRKWMKLIQRCRSNEVLLLDYLCKKNMSVVQRYFQEWRQSHKEVATEKRDQRKHQLVRNIALHWKLKTKENIHANRTRKNLSEKYFMLWSDRYHMRRKAVASHEWNMKRRFLSSWVDASQRIKDAESKVDIFRQHIDTQLVHTFFQRWRAKVRKIEAKKRTQLQLNIAIQHHHRQSLKSMFQKWELFVKVSKIKRMRESRIARKYVTRWRNSVLTGNAILSMFQHNMCEKYWRRWRSVYIRRHVLNLMDRRDERRLCSVVFASWYRYVQLKRGLPNKMATIQTRIWFLRWKEKWAASKT